MKNNYLFFLFLFLFVHVLVGQAAVSKFDQPITAKFEKSELGTALQKLSDKAGIEIIYDEKISKTKVSGSYREIPFLDVVSRLMKGFNNSLRLDPEKNTLLIKAFGEAQYVSTTGFAGHADEYITDIGIPLSELRALHEKQTEEYRQQLEDKDEFLDEVGMTRGDLHELHEQQSAEFEQEQMVKEQFLTELNMTREQLEKMHENQLAKYNEENNNQKTMLAELGVTVGEHRKMLVDQAKEYENQQQDDEEYISEIGMSRGEHRRLLAEQMKSFQQNLTQ